MGDTPFGPAFSVPRTSVYWHRQTAPLCLIVYAFAAFGLVLAWNVGDNPGRYIGAAAGLALVLLAAAFHHLTVSDQGERLEIRFGPLPLFCRTVRYDEIQSVEPGRTTLLDGWGIHCSPRGGWVWNIWGRDCVVLHLRKGMLRIGTDDMEGLTRFLAQRIGQQDRGMGSPHAPREGSPSRGAR